MQHIDVLIVDDEEKFASMLSKRVELRGCHTQVCYNGVSAIQLIEQYHGSITLILLDLQLPDLYGVEVLRIIKNINPTLPVIILTGHGTKHDQNECEALGAYDFIHKPIDIDNLMKILKAIQDNTE